MRTVFIYGVAAILALGLVRRFHQLGGPYFSKPETIQDHVSAVPYPSRDAIVLSSRAAELLPRGVTVTVLMPSQAPHHDATLYRTAVGFMPHQRIVEPDLGAKPQYVIALREPLDHPDYRPLAEFREGRIYVRR